MILFVLTLLSLDAQIEQLEKEVRADRIERMAHYYDQALLPLKQQEKEKTEILIHDLERFLDKDIVLLKLADLYFDLDLKKSIHFLNLCKNKSDATDYLLGVAYLYEGETEQAEKAFKYFLAHYPQSAYVEEIRFRLAEIYFGFKEYSTSEVYFRQILENPQSSFYVKALYKLAWIHYLQDRYPQAIHEFTQLLNLGSAYSDILKQEASRYLAASYLDSKNYFPNLGRADWARSVWIHLAGLLTKVDKNLEAAAAYRQAILLDPQNPGNLELELKSLKLSPSREEQKKFIAQYLNDKRAREAVKTELFNLAFESNAAEEYALFIRHFPEDDRLDQVLFYYAEAMFKAGLFHDAGIGFEQLRDWPWETEYHERAALNAVYAYAEEIKQGAPDFELSKIEVAHKPRFKGNVTPIMMSFVKAADALRKKFPESIQNPAFLFQTAGIFYAYGDSNEAKKRLEQIIELYPQQEPARLAAQLIVSDALSKEQWLVAASKAKRYQVVSKNLAVLEQSARFKYANSLFAEAKKPEEYHQVANLYLAILKEVPKADFIDKVLFNAAMALDRSGRYGEAEELIERLKRYPKSPLLRQAFEQRAVFFEQRLLFDKAALLYAQIPGDKDALLKAAFDFEAAQKIKQAASLFERFAKEYPGSPEAVKADYGRLEPVMQVYQAIKIDAKSSKEQARQLTLKTSKLSELQKSYERIVKNYDLSSFTLAAIYQIGVLYEGLFRSLVKAPCPNDVSRINEAACDEYVSLLEDKAYVLEKKALDAYQLAATKAMKVVGGHDWAFKAKSALYRMRPSEFVPVEPLWEVPIGIMNPSSDSEELLMSRLELQPFNLEARLQMAHIFYARKQFEAAQMTLEDSLEKAESPEVYHQLGLIYLKLGNLDKAYANLKRASEAGPNSASVQLHLGNYYAMVSDSQKALGAYESALKLEPQLLAAKLNMGLVALSEKRYDSAEAALRTFLEEAHPDADLKGRLESYLKICNQQIILEKQRHEKS